MNKTSIDLPQKENTIKPAKIKWENSTPISTEYGDVYFSKDEGLAESQYVFIKNNKLLEKWTRLSDSEVQNDNTETENPSDSKKPFVIAETGFGTGLNFLNVWQSWLQFNQANPKLQTPLHFISVEKHPLTLEDLKKALSFFPSLQAQSDLLIEQYPKLIKGLHRLNFESDNIHLTLIFNDATVALKSIDTEVDCWFLDGFSPKQNDDLWSANLFSQVKRLSRLHTSFATFTCAGDVRRKLSALGFQCAKVKGFGRKREMLIGEYVPTAEDTDLKQAIPNNEPWFTKPQQAHTKGRAAIIGSGLAGAWTAYKLANAGWLVDIFEQSEKPTEGASGNPRGALYFKMNPSADDESSFSLQGFLYCIRALNALSTKYKTSHLWEQCGVLQLGHNEKELLKQNQLSALEKDYDALFTVLDKKQASNIAGISIKEQSLFIPLAGAVSPKKLCATLMMHKNISLHLGHEVSKLSFDSSSQQWSLHFNNLDTHPLENKEDKTSLADVVVLANSFEAHKFEQTQDLPLHQVRGQCSVVKATDDSRALNTVLCSSAYASPAHENEHVIGATFDPRDKHPLPTEEDNLKNLAFLQHHTPALYDALTPIGLNAKPQLNGARASFRCQSPDYLPIVGQVPIKEHFMEDYSGLRKGQLKRDYPAGSYYPRLYVNLAHGSRGLCSTPICAELLSNLINHEPLPLDRASVNKLEPARFYIRALKRNQI